MRCLERKARHHNTTERQSNTAHVYNVHVYFWRDTDTEGCRRCKCTRHPHTRFLTPYRTWLTNHIHIHIHSDTCTIIMYTCILIMQWYKGICCLVENSKSHTGYLSNSCYYLILWSNSVNSKVLQLSFTMGYCQELKFKTIPNCLSSCLGCNWVRYVCPFVVGYYRGCGDGSSLWWG